MKKILSLILTIFIFNQLSFSQKIETGAEQISEYLPFLQGKRVGLVANQTSVVGQTHLLDTLLQLDVNIVKLFCPEHGFRGNTEAGANIQSGFDEKTKLPVISLYGKSKKPYAKDLQNIDILIFDIQDVGARFYTYISTLHYVMEAVAENNKTLLILDRPNPNGFYVDGPLLDTNLRSFVGMHPIPIVHGMTIGEYAQMINGEKWLAKGIQCQLQVQKVKNYTHSSLYELPVAPSPNLQNMNAIYLYPSLCWFEGTSVSVGRGTSSPFEIIGCPAYPLHSFSFVPSVIKGVSENPPFKNDTCYGVDLRNVCMKQFPQKIELKYLLEMYKSAGNDKFFIPFFDKLAGTTQLKEQIKKGWSEEAIRQSWEADLIKFKETRKQYLLYKDFE